MDETPAINTTKATDMTRTNKGEGGSDTRGKERRWAPIMRRATNNSAATLTLLLPFIRLLTYSFKWSEFKPSRAKVLKRLSANLRSCQEQ